MWNNILEVLKEKNTEGVDVRLIYDDPWLYCHFA